MYTVLNRDFDYNENSAVYFTNTLICDNRGYFTVGFNKDAFNKEINKNFDVIQHNISMSSLNVTRGLHFQVENNQAKIVHCLQGKVIDVIVDMRINSPFFGQGKAYELKDINTYLYVPHGFAHGFITTGSIDSKVMFEYFVDDVWNKSSEYVLNVKDYIKNNKVFLITNTNKIQNLKDNISCDLDKLEFSEKDNKLAKNYLSDENQLTNFKELVKANKHFN